MSNFEHILQVAIEMLGLVVLYLFVSAAGTIIALRVNPTLSDGNAFAISAATVGLMVVVFELVARKHEARVESRLRGAKQEHQPDTGETRVAALPVIMPRFSDLERARMERRAHQHGQPAPQLHTRLQNHSSARV